LGWGALAPCPVQPFKKYFF